MGHLEIVYFPTVCIFLVCCTYITTDSVCARARLCAKLGSALVRASVSLDSALFALPHWKGHH